MFSLFLDRATIVAASLTNSGTEQAYVDLTSSPATLIRRTTTKLRSEMIINGTNAWKSGKRRLRSEIMYDLRQPVRTRASFTPATARTTLHGTTARHRNMTSRHRRIVISSSNLDHTTAWSPDIAKRSDSPSAAQRNPSQHHCLTQHSPPHSEHPQYPSTARDSPARDGVLASISEHTLLGTELASSQRSSASSLARYRPRHLKMTSLPPFLNTPLRLSEGCILLPPLAHVCQQMRTEMRGILEKHEEDLVSDVQTGRLPIKARIINYDFVALYKWLERNEGTNDARFSPQQVRALQIDLIIDVRVIDLAQAVESQLTIQDHIARDREAIQSFNNSWNDAGPHDRPQNRFDFRLGPCVTGKNGTAAIADGYGAKSYGLKTSLGNCYVVTCNVRLNFLSTSDDSSSGSFPSGFCHQGDYLDQLFRQTPDGGPCSPGYQWGHLIGRLTCCQVPFTFEWGCRLWSDPTSSFFKVVFGGMCRARARSYLMLWDKKYYSQLPREQQSVVDYYRLLDGGIERRAATEPSRKVKRQDEVGGGSDFFEKLDAAVKMEDRMDLRK
jgi:hypothetical protein